MRRSTRTILTAAILIVATTACGALFNSGPAQVAVNSTPGGADIFVDGQRMGQTPMILELTKSDNHTVELRREGYRPLSFNLNRQVSAGYVILDVLGGLVPIVIDAATGSWYTLSESNIEGTLQPDSAGAGGELSAEELDAVKRGVPSGAFIELP
ncbi:MAG: PEGA domain-containing protein [Gemmatimonadota bacterium]